MRTLIAFIFAVAPAFGQAAPPTKSTQAKAPAPPQPAGYRAPRSFDGHADLGGIWQAVNTANWDLEDHSPRAGTMWQTGAIGAEPAGQSVVEGGSIPYKPEELAKKKANFENRRTNDPEAKCYMPGIPARQLHALSVSDRSDRPRGILLVYEFASANRLVNMGKPEEAGSDTWMGTNNGHWEGDTLVVDVTGLNGLAWFDRAGDFASNNLHVVERYTRVDPYHINYEATIEDPIGLHQALEDQHAVVPQWWTRTLSFWISSAWSSPKSCCTDNSRSRRVPTSEGSMQYAAPISRRRMSRAAVAVIRPAVRSANHEDWTPPKTPWGDPDLQGMWPGNMGVPMQRPEALGTRATLTDAEFAQKEAQAKKQAQADSESTVASDRAPASVRPPTGPSVARPRGKPR